MINFFYLQERYNYCERKYLGTAAVLPLIKCNVRFNNPFDLNVFVLYSKM